MAQDTIIPSPNALSGNGTAPPGFNPGIGKAIEIKNLVKQYKKVTAVNNISLDVYEG